MDLIAAHRSHANLKLTKVNTYGLYYEWKGSDASLKPLLLAAHQGIRPHRLPNGYFSSLDDS